MFRNLLLLPGLLLFFQSHPASAIHVLTTTGNTTAPADDPGFANVGKLNGATAIYLGSGWVLGASHVGIGTVTFGSQSFAPIGPATLLNNKGTAGMTANSDLILFQINGDPGLPPLVISPASPAMEEELVLIGNGASRQSSRSLYTVDQNSGENDDVWTPTTTSGPDVEPLFAPATADGIRWGENNVEFTDLNVDAGFGSVQSFASIFEDDPANLPNEAQAVLGDSGGAVFRKVGQTWQLTGMIHAVGTLSGYDNIPGGTGSSIPGESVTYIADLSFYRSQIVSAIPEPGTASCLAFTLAGLLRHRRRRTEMRHASVDSA